MYNPNIIIGAAVVVLVAGGVYYYYNKSSKKEEVIETKTTEETVVVEVKEETSVEEEVVVEVKTEEENIVEAETTEETVEIVESEVKEEVVRKNILLNLPAGSHNDLFKFVVSLKTNLKDHSEKEDVKEMMVIIDSFALSLFNNPKIKLRNCFKTNCDVAASFYYLQKNFTNEYAKAFKSFSKVTGSQIALYKRTLNKVK